MTTKGASPEQQVFQAPRYAKAKKRLPATAQLAADEVVRGVIADPLTGEQQFGTLRSVRVVKFKAGNQQLLAYQFHARRKVIEVLDVGPPENFYSEERLR